MHKPAGHLRIDYKAGKLKIINEAGESIEADMVTITLQKNGKARIQLDSQEVGKRVRMCDRFFANAE